MNDVIAHHNDHRGHEVRRCFLMGALDGVATRTAGPGHDDWMLGGRLTFTLPINLADLVLAQRRTEPSAPWPGPEPGP